MSEIRSFAGTAFRIVTCDDHAFYVGVPYMLHLYHVTHVFQSVVYAPVYVFPKPAAGMIARWSTGSSNTIYSPPFFYARDALGMRSDALGVPSPLQACPQFVCLTVELL